MPLYEYQCDACAHRFEVIQKFSDPPIEVCPSCGGTVRKLLSSPAIQFKGSGWYITDYARANKADGNKGDAGKGASGTSEAGGASNESASTPAKTESKPDAKATASTPSE